MKSRSTMPFRGSRAAARLLALTVICSNILGGTGWAGVAIPPDALVPLNQLAVPEPPNLYLFVKNKPAAIRLGKALFWDMQVGSDGLTACGSCHFSAGADNRRRNTVNPGSNGDFEVVAAPNQLLPSSAFPFHQRQAPVDFKGSPVSSDADDVVGSQGVALKQFVALVPGSAVDQGSALPDAMFQESGVNLRQVTGRNTPSVINAIFNFTNFWDGRASAFFNGSSPFGPLDQNAGVWYEVGGVLTKRAITLHFASLASQATGPPLNDVEMSFKGRSFPQLGRKLLGLTPLGRQTVHPEDSELGGLSKAQLKLDGTLAGAKGLKVGYAQMIRDAFRDELWNSNQQTSEGFSQMEANFSLFWGVAIQLYEATLVSDDTPFDRFLAGSSEALTPQQQDGFNLFFGAARCDACHGASELSNGSVRASGFVFNADNQDHALLELMPVASGQQIIYDQGYNNTAVRRTAEDLGRAGNSPFENPLVTGQFFPLSFAALAELQAQGKLPFSTPVLIPGLSPTFPIANSGAFKVPGLRNVELTAPYMHNGSMQTLEQVVEFYARGGNFPNDNKSQLDVNIVELPALQGDAAAKEALVAFMMSMTDERVRNEEAPFDRPEVFIANGNDAGGFVRLSAKSINGEQNGALPVVTLNPVTSPTLQSSQLLTGTKEFGATVTVQVNGAPPFTADATSDTTWSSTVPLVTGTNSITVSATDITGTVSNPISAAITCTAGLTLTGSVLINGGAALTKSQSATLTLSASGPNPATQMQLSKDGVNFFPYEAFVGTRKVTLLPGEGERSIYVRFKDAAGNVSPVASDSIIVDSTLPSGTVTINGGAAATGSASVTLTLSASDANGVSQMQFSKDGVSYFPFETFATSRTVTLSSGEGAKTIWVRFKDGAGNVSAPASDGITLDSTAPTGSIAFSTANPTSSSSAVLALSASDASGVTQMQFSKNGGAFFPLEPFAASRTVSLAPGLNSIAVRYRDAAGNLSAPVSASITRN